MARLLIISTNYAPEVTGVGPYVAVVARSLAAAGHEVDVIAGLPHYPAWRIAAGVPRKLRWNEADGRVVVHRRAHYVPSRPSALGRAALEGTFLLQGMLGVPRGMDAVIGVVPSLADGLLARIIASVLRVPYALVFQDLMGRAAEQSGTAGGSRVAAVTSRAEAWATRRARLLGMITPSFGPYLESLGASPDAFVTLRNWSRARVAHTPRDETRSRLGWGSDFVVLHAGNMGMKQGLEQVVDAAAMAARLGSRIRFVLVGDGNQRAHIAALGAAVPTLELRPLLPEAELADVLAAADVLLISERATLLDMSLPSKLTTYLAAGRPVVAAVPPGGVTAGEVVRSGGGIVVPAGRPDDLLGELERLKSNPNVGAGLVDAGQAFARDQLDEATALARYREFVDRLLSPNAQETK